MCKRNVQQKVPRYLNEFPRLDSCLEQNRAEQSRAEQNMYLKNLPHLHHPPSTFLSQNHSHFKISLPPQTNKRHPHAHTHQNQTSQIPSILAIFYPQHPQNSTNPQDSMTSSKNQRKTFLQSSQANSIR